MLKDEIEISKWSNKSAISYFQFKNKIEFNFGKSCNELKMSVTPQCLIFVGKKLQQTQLFEWNVLLPLTIPILSSNEKFILLDCGSFHGINITTKFAVFEGKSQIKESQIAVGTIAFVDFNDKINSENSGEVSFTI